MEDETDSDYQDEIENGMEDFVASENKVKVESLGDSEGKELVRLAQTPDYITHNPFKTFDDDENTYTFEDQVERFSLDLNKTYRHLISAHSTIIVFK